MHFTLTIFSFSIWINRLGPISELAQRRHTMIFAQISVTPTHFINILL